MRVFIAIELPAEIKEELLKLQKAIVSENVKQTLAKEFHLTLKFLGEVDNVEKIKQQLSKVKFNSFEISLSSIGVFPSKNYIRIVWVGAEPENKIIELQKKIDNVLDFPKEKDFKPHLTLSRVKFVKDKKAFSELLDKVHAEKKSFLVDNFKLIKSTLTPNGHVYEEIACFKSQAL